MIARLSPRLGKVAARICTEFREMPGMRLTEAQVRRAWNLSRQDSAQALDYLCESCELAHDSAGRYLVYVELGCRDTTNEVVVRR